MAAWYREWFGEDYLDLYAHRGEQEAVEHVRFVASVLASASPESKPLQVLDLACGTGRHARALAALESPPRPLRVTGVDLSLVLLTQEAGWTRARADMRLLPFRAGAFDWVLSFFTSFGYFETERENLQVLEETVRVMAPGGRLLVDFLNLETALSTLVPRERTTVPVRRGGANEVLSIDIERWWDEGTLRLNKRIRIVSEGAEGGASAALAAPRTFLESVRGYRPNDVFSGLARAGLSLVSTFGDFSGSAFDPARSERLIVVAEKTS